jgi:predicted Zn-dependent protease
MLEMQPAKLASILAIICISACATGPHVKPATRAEIVERDNAMGSELSGQFETQVKLKTEREVTVYLRKVAETLSTVSPDLRASSVGVLLLKDGDSRSWRNFGLPGNRIYLSSALLRELQFENEVAAVIAFELAHIQKRHLMDRIETEHPRYEAEDHSTYGAAYGRVSDLGVRSPESTKPLDFFGPAGLFVFKEESELEAVDAAVELLYHGGYDPRGLVGIWDTYAAHPKNCPYDLSTLQKLLDRTRVAVSGYAPLLNPIVRSPEFLAVQKRIKKL